MLESSENIFWCSIPSDILSYPSSEIPDGAKILFAVIFNLSKEKGYCYASNKYFRNTLNISDRSVNRYISALQNHDYIVVKPNPEDKRSRVIYIAQTKHSRFLKTITDNSNDRHGCPVGGDKNVTPVNMSVDFVDNNHITDNKSVDSVNYSDTTDNKSVEFRRHNDGNRQEFKDNRQFVNDNRHIDGHNNINNIFNNNRIPTLDEVEGLVDELREQYVEIKLNAKKFINYWNKRNWSGINGSSIKDWKELYIHCNHNYKKRIYGLL